MLRGVEVSKVQSKKKESTAILSWPGGGHIKYSDPVKVLINLNRFFRVSLSLSKIWRIHTNLITTTRSDAGGHLFQLFLFCSVPLCSVAFPNHAPLCKQPSIGFCYPRGKWVVLVDFFRGDYTHTHTHAHTHTHTHITRVKMQNSKHVAISTGLLHATPQMLRARDRLI